MAEEPQTSLPAWPGLRDWLRIFDGAKMALHPAKLGLALAALVLTFCWGWVLDLAWKSSGGAVPATALTDYIDASAATESAGDTVHGICELWCENTVAHAHTAMEELATLNFAGPGGFCLSVGMICRGTGWVVKEHAFFAILFFLGGLVIWSIFGAAICRIAAVQFARDDKIGMSEALQFARRRFASGFLMSPLLPVAILAVIALFMVIGGLLLWIPAIGNIFSLLFFLAILGGLAMAFVVIGSVGGGSFFWPTIAVEGSDGFDAISRSFSYFFGRPVKTILYGLTALVWGGICWFVLKFILFLTLRITHTCVSFGSMDKLDRLWPTPLFDHMYRFDTAETEGWEIFAAIVIAIFVILAIGLLWAFLASYYFSSSTIIYYLLRRDVDATDYEDVYIEEAEEAAEPLPPGAPPAGGTTESSEEGVSLPVIPSPAEPASTESAPSPESSVSETESAEPPSAEPAPPEPKPSEPGASDSESTEHPDKET